MHSLSLLSRMTIGRQGMSEPQAWHSIYDVSRNSLRLALWIWMVDESLRQTAVRMLAR